MADKPPIDKDKKDKVAPVSDMDALDRFPLSIVPLSSNSLKNAKLIKNSRMETTLELHNDPLTGSYQIKPEAITETFRGAEKDQEIIKQLAALNSYDIFSLRNSLKRIGIELEEPLQLSDSMKDRLNEYALQFTRPLIESIFGTERIDTSDAEGLQKILRDPDVARVRENLKIMTQRTGIPLQDVPKFLEDYADVFMSLAYYRFCFENIGAQIDRCMGWIAEVKKHRDVALTPQTLGACKRTEDSLRFLAHSIRERLMRLQYTFETFWKDINVSSFANLRKQIEDSHSSMGAVLCGLVVKMQAWEKAFPDSTAGGPSTRSKYIVTDLEPGLERLRTLENEARAKLGLVPLKSS